MHALKNRGQSKHLRAFRGRVMNLMTDEVRHLLVSFPEDAERSHTWAILDGLVMRVMVKMLDQTGPSGLLGQEEVTRGLNEITGLAFDSGEVQEALLRLEEAHKLAFVDRGKKSFTLDPRAVEQEREQIAKRLELDLKQASRARVASFGCASWHKANLEAAQRTMSQVARDEMACAKRTFGTFPHRFRL